MKPGKLQKRAKTLRKFARFSGIGVQIGITIYLSARLGKYLDAKYHSAKAFTVSLILIAFVYSIWDLIRKLNRINEEEKRK